MTRRAWITVLIALVLATVAQPLAAQAAAPAPLAAQAAAPAPPSGGGGTELTIDGSKAARAAAPASSSPTTLTGTFRRIVAEGTDGSTTTRYGVRTATSYYVIDLPSGTTPPASGASVTVTGKLQSGRMAATSLVTGTAPIRTEAATPPSSRVLLIRFYSGSVPAHPTTAEAQSIFVTQSNSWFRQVSRGRYGITGAVTGWVPLSGSTSCGPSMADAGLAAARRAGYNPNAYSRIIYWLPCGNGFTLGEAEVQGNQVWIYNNYRLNVIVHETGHNLGLEHASSQTCYKAGKVVFYSGSCSRSEYGDPFDAMGNKSAGFYSAYQQFRLGWLPGGVAAISASRTLSLRPYEPAGGGYKAIRIDTPTRWYWVEYRTRYGYDSPFIANGWGVQIRMSPKTTAAFTQPILLDAAPGSGDVWSGNTFIEELDRAALTPGSSVTLPEGIRISLTAQSSAVATVRVNYSAGAAKVPARVPAVKATPASGGATVRWSRPADNGMTISGYQVTASPGGVTRSVTSIGGTRTSLGFTGLVVGRRYTFAVKAFSSVGTGAPGASNAVTVPSPNPTVRLAYPTAWGTTYGTVLLGAVVTPNPYTKSPISYVEFYANGQYVGQASASPWRYSWDTSFQTPGTYNLTAKVYDQAGRSGTSATVPLGVRRPTVKITNPVPHQSLPQHTYPLTYTLTPASAKFDQVSAYIGGSQVGFENRADGTLTIDPTNAFVTGATTLELDLYNSTNGQQITTQIPIVVQGP